MSRRNGNIANSLNLDVDVIDLTPGYRKRGRPRKADYRTPAGTTDIGPEIAAISRCAEVLDRLDADALHRVWQFLADRYGPAGE